MFELGNNVETIEMIDFGRTDKNGNKKILFQLPVLGQPGIPMGIMSAFGIFFDKFSQGRSLSEAEVASAWSFFIQTLADSYADATRQLAMLDEDQFKAVIEEWVRQSSTKTGYDPKAR